MGSFSAGSSDRRFGRSPRLTRAVAISTAGDNTIVTPAAGKRIRLLWLAMATSQDNTAETLAVVKFGSTEHYRWPLGNPGAFMHWEPIEGAVDTPLVINLSAAQTVQVSYTYEEF
jgi:hypothetical protein